MLAILSLSFLFLGACKASTQSNIESLRSQLLGKKMAQVEKVLGKPDIIGHTGFCAPPRGSSDKQKAEFYRKTIAKIYTYDKVEISFNTEGNVVKVEAKK